MSEKAVVVNCLVVVMVRYIYSIYINFPVESKKAICCFVSVFLKDTGIFKTLSWSGASQNFHNK